MEKNIKVPMIVACFAIALMLSIGLGFAQQQQASVVTKPDGTCHDCEQLLFDGEETIICPVISSMLDQIIQGYESGNPVGWDLLFPGYSSGFPMLSERSEYQQVQSQYTTFSVPLDGEITRSDGDISIIKKTDIDDGTSISKDDITITQPYASEQEIYERAVEMSNHCDYGNELGDWFGSDLPGDCEDKRAYKMAVLQCFKLSAPAILGSASVALTAILTSAALLVFSIFQVAQIIVGWAQVAYSVALQIAQALHSLWNSCIDFWYPIYCEVLP